MAWTWQIWSRWRRLLPATEAVAAGGVGSTEGEPLSGAGEVLVAGSGRSWVAAAGSGAARVGEGAAAGGGSGRAAGTPARASASGWEGGGAGVEGWGGIGAGRRRRRRRRRGRPQGSAAKGHAECQFFPELEFLLQQLMEISCLVPAQKKM